MERYSLGEIASGRTWKEKKRVWRWKSKSGFSTGTDTNKKRWTVNYAISDAERNTVYFIDLAKENVSLLNMIQRGEFVTLYGARTSENSHVLFKLRNSLYAKSLFLVNIESIDKFWISLNHSFETNTVSNIKFSGIKSASKLLDCLVKTSVKKVVLFVNEYDVLYEVGDDVRASFLRTICNIKNAKDNYFLWSSMAVGLFSILHLSSNKSMSSFNVKDSFQNPNFTKKQVLSLYKDFAYDYNFIIDSAIVENIYTRTNGILCLVHIVDNKEKNLAEFLTAEAIPELFKSTPTVAVPEKCDGFLDIVNVLKTVVHFFDQDIISRAFYRSFKTARDVYVNGQKDKRVPRESTYDTEMNRVLINWISKQRNFEVTCLWHFVEYCANEKNKHTYSDIVIKTPRQTVVLELLATATRTQLNEHFVRAIEFGNKISAEDVWIVHFTCEDNSTQNPYYPSITELCRLNIVHFLHDEKFKNVRMSARFMDSSNSFSYINDELIKRKRITSKKFLPRRPHHIPKKSPTVALYFSSFLFFFSILCAREFASAISFVLSQMAFRQSYASYLATLFYEVCQADKREHRSDVIYHQGHLVCTKKFVRIVTAKSTWSSKNYFRCVSGRPPLPSPTIVFSMSTLIFGVPLKSHFCSIRACSIVECPSFRSLAEAQAAYSASKENKLCC
ncbi:9298_t:CDS:2 [Funneliformis mosseae]|uniref:9298_t:CDS:1 n=1 Tax=Funneliformis mosseae TaxID=27381 RepID=A0A9N8ZAA0_FUNMO|nr:9298_t:CDS:2 [Funneliformis mosseae]